MEFYKYLYAGSRPPAPPTNIKHISQKWKSQTNVSNCPVVHLTSHLSFHALVHIVEAVFGCICRSSRRGRMSSQAGEANGVAHAQDPASGDEHATNGPASVQNATDMAASGAPSAADTATVPTTNATSATNSTSITPVSTPALHGAYGAHVGRGEKLEQRVSSPARTKKSGRTTFMVLSVQEVRPLTGDEGEGEGPANMRGSTDGLDELEDTLVDERETNSDEEGTSDHDAHDVEGKNGECAGRVSDLQGKEGETGVDSHGKHSFDATAGILPASGQSVHGTQMQSLGVPGATAGEETGGPERKPSRFKVVDATTLKQVQRRGRWMAVDTPGSANATPPAAATPPALPNAPAISATAPATPNAGGIAVSAPGVGAPIMPGVASVPGPASGVGPIGPGVAPGVVGVGPIGPGVAGVTGPIGPGVVNATGHSVPHLALPMPPANATAPAMPQNVPGVCLVASTHTRPEEHEGAGVGAPLTTAGFPPSGIFSIFFSIFFS